MKCDITTGNCDEVSRKTGKYDEVGQNNKEIMA
jgi:hypothetical protein